MTKSLSVRPLPDDWAKEEYCLFIAVIGYEKRARFIAETMAPASKQRGACGFETQQVLEYQANTDWMASHGFDVSHTAEIEFDDWLGTQLAKVEVLEGLGRILVDISSMTRFRVASVILAIEKHFSFDAIVTFVYSLAKFSTPQEATFPNSHVGPVRPEFAGWWQEPDLAVAAVVGLGYEEDKALGAVEHLQAGEVWAFIPESPIAEYTQELQSANRTLLETVESKHQLPYHVQDPFECFARLESLVFGLSQSSNVVLLPFGPKIFSLCSLLVGRLHQRVPVWRVSAEGQEPAVNREASGAVYGLEVRFTVSQRDNSSVN